MKWQMEVRHRFGDFQLDIAMSGEAETVAIIGPNGAGKTSLLRVLAGAVQPDFGHWQCGEQTLFQTERGLYVPPENRGVGYVPQGCGLFPHLSVLDNVGFGWIPQGLDRTARHARAKEWLHTLGVGHLVNREVDALSGGEQQSIALARALAVNPGFLLLDEPLAALDAVSRHTLRTWLQEHLHRRLAPTILVTHDARDVRALATQVVVVENGRVLQSGTPKAVAASPVSPFVSAFFGVSDTVESTLD